MQVDDESEEEEPRRKAKSKASELFDSASEDESETIVKYVHSIALYR